MKFNEIVMIVAGVCAGIGSIANAQESKILKQYGQDAFSIGCQLQTNDDKSATYSLDFYVVPSLKLLSFKTLAYNEAQGVYTIAEGNNAEFNGNNRDLKISVTGQEGSKLLTVVGTGDFFAKTSSGIAKNETIIQLTQVKHPEDHTRASGVIFHGVKFLSNRSKKLLPPGVVLTGIGNCYEFHNFDSQKYKF